MIKINNINLKGIKEVKVQKANLASLINHLNFATLSIYDNNGLILCIVNLYICKISTKVSLLLILLILSKNKSHIYYGHFIRRINNEL